jgi:hypothetical protein
MRSNADTRLRESAARRRIALENLELMFHASPQQGAFGGPRRWVIARGRRRQMGQEGAAEDQSRRASGHGQSDAMLIYAGQRLRVHGRALRLILWVAFHQQQINEVAADRGQLWLSWKGSGANSIEGNLKVPL